MTKRDVYLDYVASTPLCREAIDAMFYAMTSLYGNPSSTHHFGRKSNVIMEQSRKTVADLLDCSAKNLVFTSGATETINLGIKSICKTYKTNAIISSPLEHPATLKAIEEAVKLFNIPLVYVRHNEKGNIDLSNLDEILHSYSSALLCLMHANNEIGNLLPVQEVGTLCRKYNTLFFCDMVQTVGKYSLALSQIPVDFAVVSAHKFYGPKASGLLYYTHKIDALLSGGYQERNMRAGTENIYGIYGMEKALQKSIENLDKMQTFISGIKSYCIERLTKTFSNIIFVGDCKDGGLYNLINFYFPDTDIDIVRMRLDIAGIAVSSASACSSGSEQKSHVLNALGIKSKSLRVSFGVDTTKEDIDYFILTLSEIILDQ
ncbi:MAG: cysteine desulfurase [Bacteroidales bacterium]|jgi:cysteine desulfurase|nr:cysteine desulfurase [Bacteroidales bacterium]